MTYRLNKSMMSSSRKSLWSWRIRYALLISPSFNLQGMGVVQSIMFSSTALVGDLTPFISDVKVTYATQVTFENT